MKKQRKKQIQTPLHILHKRLSANLSKELRKKYNIRSLPLRKGDKVRIMVGQFKKKTGIITKVILKKLKVYIEGITQKKADGSTSPYPIHPSNLQIIELNLDDRLRFGKKQKIQTATKTKQTIGEDKKAQ